MSRIVTENYGLAGGQLDVTDRVALLRPGADGYVDMTRYNESAPWAGMTHQANAVAAELRADHATRN